MWLIGSKKEKAMMEDNKALLAQIETLRAQLETSRKDADLAMENSSRLDGMYQATLREANAATHELSRLTIVPGLAQPKSPFQSKLSRKLAEKLYGCNDENRRCEQTVTSYIVNDYFGEKLVRYVIPKVAPVDTRSGEFIKLTAFHEYPELIEGLTLEDVAETGIYLRFLFATCWIDVKDEVLHIRPASPKEATHIIVEQTGEANKADDYSDVGALLNERHATQIDPAGFYHLLGLDVFGMDYDASVDIGYSREDYYRLCAENVERLRAACEERWQGYFNPEVVSSKASEPTGKTE